MGMIEYKELKDPTQCDLDDAGRDGWDLVTAFVLPRSEGFDVWYTFARYVEPEPEPAEEHSRLALLRNRITARRQEAINEKARMPTHAEWYEGEMAGLNWMIRMLDNLDS